MWGAGSVGQLWVVQDLQVLSPGPAHPHTLWHRSQRSTIAFIAISSQPELDSSSVDLESATIRSIYLVTLLGTSRKFPCYSVHMFFERLAGPAREGGAKVLAFVPSNGTH